MRPIEKLWRSYLRGFIPRGGGQIQIRETRMAFYAGAQALFNLVRHPLTEIASELEEFRSETEAEQ